MEIKVIFYGEIGTKIYRGEQSTEQGNVEEQTT